MSMKALAAAFSAIAAGYSMAAKELLKDDDNPGGTETPPARAAVGGATKKAGAKKDAVTIDTLRDKITGYVNDKKSGGPDRGMALLQRFGVEKLSALDKSQYAEFNEALDKCINGEDDPLQATDASGGEDPFA